MEDVIAGRNHVIPCVQIQVDHANDAVNRAIVRRHGPKQRELLHVDTTLVVVLDWQKPSRNEEARPKALLQQQHAHLEDHPAAQDIAKGRVWLALVLYSR